MRPTAPYVRSLFAARSLVIGLFLLSGGPALAQTADGTVAHPFTDLEEGKDAARAEKKPLLVLFQTEGCAFTQLFFDQTVPDPSVQSALSDLIIASLDVSAGKGKFVGMMHEVKMTPTFVLYDPDRGPLHQWKGWGQIPFLQNLGGGLRSNTLVTDRLKRYEASPTAEDAALLGFFWASTGNYAASFPAFRKATELNPDFDFTAESFDVAASGYAAGQLGLSELRAGADELLKRTGSIEETVNVASILTGLTERTGAGNAAAPYLAEAASRAAGSEDVEIRRALQRLEPYRLLYLETDPDAAVTAYQARYPGWPDDPDALNNVAWWCQAHGIHLDRAEAWAREAVAKYREPEDRANARDTLADILLRTGRTEEAVEQLFRAFEEAPQILAYGQKLKELGADIDLPELGEPGAATPEPTSSDGANEPVRGSQP